MLDITVKTIDGHNRCYSIPDNYMVHQFKEKISMSLNIPADRQRLIFQGREMKDDRYLKDFDVNGKTIHLVQRTPPSLLFQGRQVESNRLNRTDAHHTPTRNFNASAGLPSNTNPAGNQNPNELGSIQTILNQILGGISESIGTNTNNNERNVGVNIHIDVTNMTQTLNEQEIRNRLHSLRRLIVMARTRMKRIEEIQSGAPLDENPPEIPPENDDSNTLNIQVESLGNLVNDAMILYANVQPHLLNYYNLLMQDANEPVIENNENRRQRFCNNINDMMHLLGHIFHNLSDLHVNLRDNSPRNIRIMIPFQTAIISTSPIFAGPQAFVQNISNISSETAPFQLFSSGNNPLSNNSGPNNTANNVPPPSFSTTSPHSDTTYSHNDQTNANSHQTNNRSETSNSANQTPQRASLPTQLTRDQYLQCNSVHFFNSLVNNAQIASNMPRNQAPTYHGLALINNGPQRRRHPASDQSTANTIDSNNLESQNITNSNQRANSSNNSVPSNSGNMQFLSNLINSVNIEQSSQSNNTGIEILRTIMTIVDNNNPQDERLQRPLSQIINRFNNEAGQSSNSIMLNLVDIIFKSLTLNDMMNLATANNLNEVFKSTKKDLKCYIENILAAQSETFHGNEDALVDKMYQDIICDLKIKLDDFEVIDRSVNFELSIEKIIKNYLKILLNHILYGSEDNWGCMFYEKIIDFKDNMIAFLRLTVKDANSKICKLLCSNLEGTIFSSNTNQLIRNAFQSFISDHLNEIISNTNVNNTAANQFIVYKIEDQNLITESIDLNASKQMLENSKINTNITDEDESRTSILPIAWRETVSRDSVIQNNYHTSQLSSDYKSGLHKRQKVSENSDLSPNSYFNIVLHKSMKRMHKKKERKDYRDHINTSFINAFDARLDGLIEDKLRTGLDTSLSNFHSNKRYSFCYNAHKRLHSSSDNKLNFTKKRII